MNEMGFWIVCGRLGAFTASCFTEEGSFLGRKVDIGGNQ